MKNFKSAISIHIMLILIAAGTIQNTTAADVDWNSVESKTVKVFYPGVASWDFLRSEDHGRGANVVKKREKACVECHVSKEGAYDIKGDQIISGELKKAESKEEFEPRPAAGAPGFKDLTVQAAYDDENIYLMLQWPGSGASVTDPTIAANGKADRVAVQISDKIGTFRNYGCYITCHNDQSGMPENDGSDTKLYGYYTRSKNEVVPQDKLDEFISKGQFIDLWVFSFEGNQVKASDLYILHDRIEDRNDLTATGSYENGTYTVVITRKLATGDDRDIVLNPDEPFSIGVAVHDNQHNGRQHYTSFPMTIGTTEEADVKARKF